VNTTSRIESYTVGGQILISESVYREAGDILRIDAQQDITSKGLELPLRVYEVGGIAGSYNLVLEGEPPVRFTLAHQIPLQYNLIESKDFGAEKLTGFVTRLSKIGVELIFGEPVSILTNLKMNLGDVDEKLAAKDFYGKVIRQTEDEKQIYEVRFTSVPPEVDAYLQALRQHAVAR
jgi:adenylate cyclase